MDRLPRLATLALLASVGTAGVAAPPQPTKVSSASIVALEACQKLSDGVSRLACLDRSVGELVAAARAGQVTVVDQQSARAMRRSLFGFSVPNLKILSGGDNAESQSLEAKVQSARATPNGRYRIRLTDGAIWETVERPDAGEEPRTGSVIRLRRAMLGSYFMNVDGHRAVRARRVE